MFYRLYLALVQFFLLFHCNIIASVSCVTGVGCVVEYFNSSHDCSDGNLCTVGDHCSGVNGTCISGYSVDCGQMSQCESIGTIYRNFLII